MVSDQLYRLEQKKFSLKTLRFGQAQIQSTVGGYFERKNGSLSAINSSFVEKKNRSFVKSKLFT